MFSKILCYYLLYILKNELAGVLQTMVINVLYGEFCYLDEIPRNAKIVDIKLKVEKKVYVPWVRLDLAYNEQLV